MRSPDDTPCTSVTRSGDTPVDTADRARYAQRWDEVKAA